MAEGAGDLVERVAGIVLAGGMGTRLFPLTKSRCKPSVGFGGRYRLIDIPLSNALNSKITKLFVISQHFASTLHQHILTTYRFDLFRRGGIELLSPDEDHEKKVRFEGTADAVRKNLDHIMQAPVDYFLILSGDQLYNMDLEALVHFAEDKNADMVVASLYVDTEEAQRMGVMKIDNTFHIKEFCEKPKEPSVIDRFVSSKGVLASMGIYVFRRDVLFQLLQEQGNDFGHHLIPFQAAKGNSFAYVYDGYWVDIGTIKSFYDANMALLERDHCLNIYDEGHPIFTLSQNIPSPFLQDVRVKKSYISQGSIIEGAEIEHSVLGMRCRVKKGTRIHRSILMGNQFYVPPLHQHPPLPSSFQIGENCLIEKAIIDEHAFIGDNVRLINEKNLQSHDGEGLCICDGIIIVQAGTTIPSGFTL
ncbi:MAG TPA: sugar phosphate nucleotidyltransferase [Rhabdochlamydiaceae bacterium]|nr:sugar phosphate nucleotidyltransferase [Rhabdochlamydiaceae bacterium]